MAYWDENHTEHLPGGEIMAKDPVCGMHVDPAKAAGTSEYQGTTYGGEAEVAELPFSHPNPGECCKVPQKVGPLGCGHRVAVRPRRAIPAMGGAE